MKRAADASLMRSVNRAAILNLIRERGPISRRQIEDQLHMSMPTVMRIVDELIEDKLVRDQGTSLPTGGRRSPLLEFDGEHHAVIAVDLGTTRMYGTVADLNGRLQEEAFLDFDNGNLLEQLKALIDSLLNAPRPSGQQIRGIGVGVPGIVLHPEGIVTWAPHLEWRNLPLKQILSDAFGLPVFVENDINLAALGEFGFGSGKNTNKLVLVTVGRTGIGSGIILNGALYRGHNQVAGEVGYLLQDTRQLGPRQEAVGIGGLAGEKGIIRRALHELALAGRTIPPDEVNLEFVFEAARRQQEWARRVIDETIDCLAVAVISISVLLDPELILLGGNVTRCDDHIIDRILYRLQGVAPIIPRLEVSTLRGTVVMGAIMLVLNATTDQYVVRQVS